MSTITPEILSRFLETSLELARHAGEAIQAVARESLDVRSKEDGSPLTRADQAGHDVIQAGLETLTPRFPIISEEGDPATFSTLTEGPYWLVDPLDGTKEFIQGRSDYTVNIALLEDYQPILGVIYAPAHGVMYYGVRGMGAFRQVDGETPVAMTASTNETPQSAVASRSHLSPETEEFLERNGITETRSHGSSIKICAIAEGSADVYPRFGLTCLWDTAAGTAIARQARCRVLDLAGNDLHYNPAAGIKREGFIVVPETMTIQL